MDGNGHTGSTDLTCLCSFTPTPQQRGASNYREAYKLLKETFGNLPDVDHDVKLKVAKASVSYLRTATNANAVMVDGISDCEENRRLWREYAYEAYDLLKDVHKARPDDPHVHVLMAEVGGCVVRYEPGHCN